jgi:hypothetical protein
LFGVIIAQRLIQTHIRQKTDVDQLMDYALPVLRNPQCNKISKCQILMYLIARVEAIKLQQWLDTVMLLTKSQPDVLVNQDMCKVGWKARPKALIFGAISVQSTRTRQQVI